MTDNIDNLRAANIAYAEQVAKLIGRAGNAEMWAQASEDRLAALERAVGNVITDMKFTARKYDEIGAGHAAIPQHRWIAALEEALDYEE